MISTLQNDNETGNLSYLSTQQYSHKNENDGDENDTTKLQGKETNREKESDNNNNHKFQTPCQQLTQSKLLDPTLDWAGNLILESCNLWMGCTATTVGSCPGLHREYHDNFCLLFQGSKEFRLYSPDAALYVPMHGDVDLVYPNGVISYIGNETLPAGRPASSNMGTAAAAAAHHPENGGSDDDEDDDE